MYIVQKESVVDTSDLQTELERTKERFENCIIKKETEYTKLWNDWYKKCNECKYDKISYEKAYKDMQQKIERLQAQLGDLKGKCKDTSHVSDTQNQLSQKLKNANVELEFQDGKKNLSLMLKEILQTQMIRCLRRTRMFTQEIRDQLNAEAEAVQIILTGIDNDIYSTVDACPNACEMWKAIERLKQGESINVQDLKTNLFWEFGKFTSPDGESLESYYSRFYKMMNELTRN
uniref:Gag-Pol polyprotein n=1 Tax=Tanacetum cinerariifolium TaxID=118510 RepID=A0A699KD05_TANCI|nr:hypothetical protein [Tanacetum cinerariifolium]